MNTPCAPDAELLPAFEALDRNGDGTIKLGVLPLARFLNGHTFFVQHAHTLPNAAPPLSVHMTYQFAEGSKFAYGKRQRLREAGLWLVDDNSYYSGRYVMASAATANLPFESMGPHVDSRDAVKKHLAEANHRAAVLPLFRRRLLQVEFFWRRGSSG